MDFFEEQLNRETIKQVAPEVEKKVRKEIVKSRAKVIGLKVAKLAIKSANKVDSKLDKKVTSKRLTKKNNTRVVYATPDYNLTRPMQRDKSRFFKTEWEEEKKQLFFN